MRLTCPNCSARYDVDDNMVGPDGRDVQCANCGTTWFQPGRRPAGAPRAVRVARNAQVDPTASAPPTQPTQSTPPAPPQQPAPARRDLDPEVRDILRQEADREARLRRAAQSGGMETQSEMPLETPRQRPLSRADLDDAKDAFETEATAETVISRRDLLPDIEEINSTLRATGDRSHEDSTSSDIETMETSRRRRRGVRLGFLMVLIAAIASVLIYDNSDVLIDALPQAEPAVRAFENGVNTARFWLDDMARTLAERTAG